ncbi:3-oxoacyl-ACP synthase [Streptomyces sp. B1866]|uniref:3-oxoacyl-ACP synthase n=1 Tax=Streptomyces sp. B1866 TaxID=3075431 RepID=UPI00289116D6|nr:3-oxoacyl-ACP synthase [Streptomyces sp. B1866]MDT3395182.1 3-oxoacyl-ACP synthase [Streptomyces sp. B1866]
MCGPAYVLGEQDADHTTVTGLIERARTFDMPVKASLWGWGRVRRTAKDVETLAVESSAATLRGCGAEPESVDGLILCSTRFPGGPVTHGRFVERVLRGLGVGGAAFTGITLNRCTNLLVGIRTAQALVAAGHHRRVLVVTTDRVTDESVRMESFALFSDGAASCLVSDEPLGPDTYEIVGGASAQDPDALDWSHEISADLARIVNERILGTAGMKAGDVDGVLHPNLFRPVIVLKERQAGFTQDQLFLENIGRTGHCFAADPLINLVDRAVVHGTRPDGHYLEVTAADTIACAAPQPRSPGRGRPRRRAPAPPAADQHPRSNLRQTCTATWPPPPVFRRARNRSSDAPTNRHDRSRSRNA